MDIHISAEKLCDDKLRELCEKYNVSFGDESKGFGGSTRKVVRR